MYLHVVEHRFCPEEKCNRLFASFIVQVVYFVSHLSFTTRYNLKKQSKRKPLLKLVRLASLGKVGIGI